MDDDTLFETARLRCRRWRATDVDAVHALYADPEVVRWVGDGRPITFDESRQWMDVTANNVATRGYGMSALEDRATGDWVGCCGLVHPGGQAEAEVKYALHRAHWGRGLAREAVAALLAWGARVHGLTRVIATVAPGNAASQRVLMACGARADHLRRHDDGSDTCVFVWQADSAREGITPS